RPEDDGRRHEPGAREAVAKHRVGGKFAGQPRSRITQVAVTRKRWLHEAHIRQPARDGRHANVAPRPDVHLPYAAEREGRSGDGVGTEWGRSLASRGDAPPR